MVKMPYLLDAVITSIMLQVIQAYMNKPNNLTKFRENNLDIIGIMYIFVM